MNVKTFYLTDAGKVRTHNEDSVTILKNKSNEYLLMVADGMGGHRKGEVASSIALTHLGKRFTDIASIGTKLDAVNWLNDNVNELNKSIIDYTKEHEDSVGMGSTLVVAILTNDFLIYGNIGDSSGYVLKSGKLHKVTKDHTLVNLLVQAGNLTEEEAKFHPKKNVLMRALGATEKCEIDIFDVDIHNDGVMLCSDGLTSLMSDDQIEKVLTDPELSVEAKVQRLTTKCNARGGNDNISIAYLEKEKGDIR
jgi:protein phosphatase